jgi:N4-gp56 family major capsid protein
MAETTFATGNALTNKLWSAKFLKEMHKRTWFGKFMGEGEDNIVQVKTETSKSPGDNITVGLVMSLTGDGVTEGTILEGNEEDMTFYSDSVTINELYHAVKVRNKTSIDQQRIPEQMRALARNRLAQWYAMRMDTTMFLHLAGYTGGSYTLDGATVDPTKAQWNGNNTIVAPGSTRKVYAGGNSADEGMTSQTDDKFILELIDKALLIAKTTQPLIQPINVGGEDKFVCFLHPSQVRDLRTDVSTSRITWYDTQKAQLQGGQSASKNAIYTGALGEYNGVVLHESFRVPNGVNSTSGARVANSKRAILCGRQAAMVGYGREYSGSTRYKWYEELFDYQRSLGVGVGVVWGITKTIFNSVDYGSIVISTYGED